MNKEEKNVYTNLFEYPTKIIVRLENENEKLQQENKRLKEEYVILQNVSDQVEDELRENYNKALSILEDFDLSPCDSFDDYFDCCECDYCKEKCSNGDKNCWKNFIENYYKNKEEDK